MLYMMNEKIGTKNMYSNFILTNAIFGSQYHDDKKMFFFSIFYIYVHLSINLSIYTYKARYTNALVSS